MTSMGGESNVHSQTNHPDSMSPPHIGHAYNIQSQVSAINSRVLALLYEVLQLGNHSLQDGCTNPIFMFGQIISQEININNIKISLIHISDFISNKELKNNREEDILFLKGFGQITFDFISSVFKGGQDQLKTEKITRCSVSSSRISLSPKSLLLIKERK